MKKFISMFLLLVFSNSPLISSAQGSPEDPSFEEAEKTNWYWYDCAYTQGKECKELVNNNFCAKSKNRPFSGC